MKLIFVKIKLNKGAVWFGISVGGITKKEWLLQIDLFKWIFIIGLKKRSK